MFVTQKLGIKLLQVGKIMKIKHSVSSPLQGISGGGGGGELFLKKALHEETNFTGQICGGSFRGEFHKWKFF